MTVIIGTILVIGLVFGGYMLSGGKMDILLHALPFEGMMVGGAAIGAFVISNSVPMMFECWHGVIRALRGPRWSKADYADVLKLLYELTRLYRNRGILAVEPHIERPETSDIFARYPRILAFRPAKDLIIDSFRMISMQFDDPYQVEDVLNRRIEIYEAEVAAPASALLSGSDGLPAIGIVAAVLGVIKTMASVDEPPEILGAMIAGALVGTFLGVFMAYCMVQPVASRLNQIEEQDAHLMKAIRDMIASTVKGNPPNICAEVARGNLPSLIQPSFEEVEQAQRSVV
ncbi:flagellar motor stator protein MotA [Falsigemmobacter faecalis]|uniref:Flagellar motor stator protein MotA n=1 Tax=Falsigemmobacter faecalis TaxID=2488730 RepID=A0A3P3DNP6_9RHOB|nr:flagellar motor stator protein MotA [Falsigemmobacter faecalis]RRH75795.1 flagellar motor stator protein MotA [Falsigemmobacter faecalis]